MTRNNLVAEAQAALDLWRTGDLDDLARPHGCDNGSKSSRPLRTKTEEFLHA